MKSCCVFSFHFCFWKNKCWVCKLKSYTFWYIKWRINRKYHFYARIHVFLKIKLKDKQTNKNSSSFCFLFHIFFSWFVNVLFLYFRSFSLWMGMFFDVVFDICRSFFIFFHIFWTLKATWVFVLKDLLSNCIELKPMCFFFFYFELEYIKFELKGHCFELNSIVRIGFFPFCFIFLFSVHSFSFGRNHSLSNTRLYLQ